MVMSIEKKRGFSFAIDWIILIILCILMWVTSRIPPFERQFKLDDITISHPHKGDTVKMMHLIIFCLASSFIVITGFQLRKSNLKYNYHQAMMGVLFAIAISTIFAHVIKMFVGRYRPDFISVCNVDFDKVQAQYNSFNITSGIGFGPRNLFDTSICKTPKKSLYEERRSFPSGHSAFAFCVMSYLSLYIAGQIHLMDKRSFVWKYVVVSIPYLIAIMVALSRVFDYRHHWQDVTVGSLLGLFFGVVTYFYYFPSLFSAECDIPYQRYDGYIRKDKTNNDFNDDAQVV